MPRQQAISMLLARHSPQDGFRLISGFTHALTEARTLTHRSIDSGVKDPAAVGQYGSWLGALGYFALLDQIGKCFKPGDAPTASHGHPIGRALKHFTTLSHREVEALYALRCAFAHDYSLYNVSKIPERMHNFVVGQGQSPLVALPEVPWDGRLENQAAHVKTVVSLEAFGDLVEFIVARINALAASDSLHILLPGGSDELVRRYMFGSKSTA